MRKYLIIFLIAASSWLANAEEPMNLWPGVAPGEKQNIGEEHDTTKATDGLVAGKPVIRLGNVSVPMLTRFAPADGKANGAAVVVCPGGGYSILAMDLEGTEVCQWLNSNGVTAFLLKYRVPARAGLPRYAPPLQDAQRALGLVRFHAKEWQVDPKRIGIMGFSAGGHLTAMASSHFSTRTYPAVDGADAVSCRPDFAMLIYPAYLAQKDGTALSEDFTSVALTNVPPTFIAQTEDDPVRVENSLAWFIALKQARVPVEMHLFPDGGHGYGLRRTEKAVTGWPKLAEAWMRTEGFIGDLNSAPGKSSF